MTVPTHRRREQWRKTLAESEGWAYGDLEPHDYQQQAAAGEALSDEESAEALRVSDAATNAILKARDTEIERLRAELEQALATAAVLAPMFEGLERIIATSSRDWGPYRVDAWLYAVLVGWDCKQAEHDETCVHGAMDEIADRHGWDKETVAKARRYREAVRAITAGTAP